MKAIKALGFVVLISFIALAVMENIAPKKMDRIRYPLEYKEEIVGSSAKHNLDPYLVCAIIYVESKFDPDSESRVGAIGLMQIMPDTGKWVAEKQGRTFAVADLSNPSVNIDAGCWYFKYLLTKYKNEKLALAAYNSGFKNVDEWLQAKNYATIDEMISNIPFTETRDFIARVDEAKEKYKDLYSGEFSSSGINNVDSN